MPSRSSAAAGRIWAGTCATGSVWHASPGLTQSAAAVEDLLAEARDRRPSVFDELKPYPHQRWNADCTNVAEGLQVAPHGGVAALAGRGACPEAARGLRADPAGGLRPDGGFRRARPGRPGRARRLPGDQPGPATLLPSSPRSSRAAAGTEP